MTTAHVSAAILEGPPPTVSELLAGLENVLQRHPMLAACVRGKSKYHVPYVPYVPYAQPYPIHSDYLGRAFAYAKELMRTYPDDDIQRSPRRCHRPSWQGARSPSWHCRVGRARMWRKRWRRRGAWGFSEAMDGFVLDEDGDGPLWWLTLYAPSGAGASARSSALVFAANHAVSDQLSFNRVLSEVLSVLAERRTGRPVAPRIPPPQIRQSHHDESQDRDESLQVIASSCSFDVGCALAGTHRSKLHYRIRGCVWILGFFRAPFRTGDSDGTSVSRV